MMSVLSESELIVTAGHPFTVTVAVLLFAVPQLFVTRTQYCVVTAGCTVSSAAVWPLIGCDVLPVAPMNH